MIDFDDLKIIIEMDESIEREINADRGKFNDSVVYEEHGAYL